jgi:hypothetical protein
MQERLVTNSFSFSILFQGPGLFLSLANHPDRLMLKFFNIAKPFNAARSIPLLLTIRFNTGINIRNRAYSSYTPRPSINTKQNNDNLKGPAGFSGLKQEDEDILNRLLHLIQARKFDDLFGSLNFEG